MPGPPPGPPIGPPGASPGGEPSKRSAGRLVALGAGAILLIAAGVFAFTRLGGSESQAGGADSPEAAGRELLAALEDEDVLGVVDVMLPGERETLRDPMVGFIDELRRMEALGEDASLADVQGVDIVIEDEAVAVEETNVDDIVNLTLSGTVRGSIDGEDLPLGDLVLDNLPDDADVGDASVEGEPQPFDGFPLTAVQEDGRWYVSAFYTAAEQARLAAGSGGEPPSIPTEGIEPTGGDSPEDAFDAFLDASAALDVGGLIAALNPDEFGALQRYAPLFLDDVDAAMADVEGVEIHLEEPQYETDVDGDTASITLTYLAGRMTAEGETVTFALEDGCLTAEVAGEEPFDTCELAAADPLDELPPELGDPAREAIDLLGETFSDYSNPGIIMKRVDGTWYLSPMASGAEQMLAVMRAIDRDEIEELVSRASDLGTEVMNELENGDLGVPDVVVDDGNDTTADTMADPIEEPVDDPLGDDSVAPEEDPTFECYTEPSGTAAADCFARLVDSGDIDPAEIPPYLRAPQCGLAEAYWEGDLYDMDDATYVAAIEKAVPCFEELVASGELDEFDLPLEIANPECLEGRNRHTAGVDDPGYDDRFYDCVFG